MSGFWGADVEALRGHAEASRTASEALRTILTRCGALVDAVEWTGPDADAFRERWSGEVAPTLESAAAGLESDGRELTGHAEEQDETSSPGAGVGGGASAGAGAGLGGSAGGAVAALGAGVGLGDGPAPGTAEGFEDFDLAIIDTRALAVLGGTRRAALAEAIAGGLGVLLRVDGPLSAPVRARMAALGMAVEGEGALEPVALPRIEEADLLRARMGPGSEDAPFDPALAGEALPELERRAIAPAVEDAAPLQTGAAPVFAWWRAVGRGRVGLWTLTDSYPLALAGRDDLHAGLWSTMASALARPVADSGPWSDPQARTGTRMALCGLTVTEAVVRAPDGIQTPVRVDPAAGAEGCAAYWPSAAGWHLLTMQKEQRGQEAKDTQWYFHVRTAGEAPGIEAAALQEATLRLAAGTDVDGRTQVAGTTVRRGSSWPWFIAWLAASGLLWWLERRRAAAPASATVSRQPPPEQD